MLMLNRCLISLWSASIFVFASSVHAGVVLSEDFEDLDLTYSLSTPAFTDGNADYLGIAPLQVTAQPGSPFSGFSGSGFFVAEDIDDNNTRPETATLNFSVDISNVTDLAFDILFAAGGNDGNPPAYDLNDGFLATASIDGGPVQNLLAFEATGTNTALLQDTDFDGVGDGAVQTSAFTQFTSAIIGNGSLLDLNITVTSNDGNGEFAFDDVTIRGTAVPTTAAVPEPSTFAVLGIAAIVFGGMQRRRKRRNVSPKALAQVRPSAR